MGFRLSFVGFVVKNRAALDIIESYQRIIEWLELEGASRTIELQPPSPAGGAANLHI